MQTIVQIVGYEHVKGQVLESSDLGELFSGLSMNDIHHYSHLLTGLYFSLRFCFSHVLALCYSCQDSAQIKESIPAMDSGL